MIINNLLFRGHLSSDHPLKFITKCNSFSIAKCDSFLLQSTTNNITKCDRYCKVRRLILQSAPEDPGPPLISVSRNGNNNNNNNNNKIFI